MDDKLYSYEITHFETTTHIVPLNAIIFDYPNYFDNNYGYLLKLLTLRCGKLNLAGADLKFKNMAQTSEVLGKILKLPSFFL